MAHTNDPWLTRRENLKLASADEVSEREKLTAAAVEYIRKTIPASDVGARMVMAAFLQDTIDRDEYVLEEDRRKGGIGF